MNHSEKNQSELSLILDNLVNTSLVVASVCAPFLLGFSIIRAIQIQEYFLLYTNAPALLSLFFITIFRKKISKNTKSIYLIILLLFVAYSDLINVGYMSMAYVWLVAACVSSVVYFSFRKSLIVLFVSLGLIFSLLLLKSAGIELHTYNYNEYARRDIVLVLRATSFAAATAMITFSFQNIIRRFNRNNELLAEQKANLLNSTNRMRKEIDIRKQTEKAVLESEQKFRNIFASSSDPMIIVGADREIKDYNTAFYGMVEEDYEDLIGLDFMKIIPRAYSSFFEEIKDDVRNVPSRFDLVYKSELSEKRMFLEATTSQIDYDGALAILAIFRDNTDKRNRERIMYSAALEAEERERLRMSKELHDGLGPLLSTLKIYYEALEQHPDNMEIRDRIKSILNDSITSVKEISNNLSPYVLQNLGVVKALKAFIDKIVFAGKLNIEFNSNLSDRLNEKIEITIYRLVTELINNTLKYAKAKNVQITLIKEGTSLAISYSDDGCGFDLDRQKLRSEGIGLFNMKSRIENMGGVCQFFSAPGNGFSLTAKVDIVQGI